MGSDEAAGGISAAFLKLLADERLAGRTVLDVGTGRGRLALALAPRCGRVVGVGRALPRGAPFAFVAFHADQWRETGRRSRFAWSEDEAASILAAAGFSIEHLSVEREVQEFAGVAQARAAVIALEEKWRADGRWFRYIKFLE